MNEKKILSLLGLCRRAGKLVSGNAKVEGAIQNGTALLVLIASDASDNTKKKFTDKCMFYEVPHACVFSKDSLGSAIGYEERAVTAVTDAGFADKLTGLMEGAVQTRFETPEDDEM